MQKLFEFVEHIGKLRVLIQTRDINNGAVTTDKLGDLAVTTAKIADGAVTPEKLHPRVLAEVVKPLTDGLDVKYGIITDDIEDLIRALDAKYKAVTDELRDEVMSATHGGVALKQEFGDERHYGVSQWALTEFANWVSSKFAELTGKITHGIRMEVTPGYFISDHGCEVKIEASTVETNGKFESIAFYEIVGGEKRLIVSENGKAAKWDAEDGEPVDSFAFPEEGDSYRIEDTTVIKCEAKILGVMYEEQKTIHHYSQMWLGAGDSEHYEDIMVNENLIEDLTEGMRKAKNVTVSNEGDKIIVIVGKELAGFIRIDMNGLEIHTNVGQFVKDGTEFQVYISRNGFLAGSYNINVNG